eukprot:TRINITY_DN5684_c0_g1_i1.p1 TRINITY_DN5684_c0_g1~~TRINITY_DN5684_c0_g1_i1.p1  ORF type:complete len:390 (+),score=-53.17 TRINITY_DN5684_c0_g1_i1:2840-4009(+)
MQKNTLFSGLETCEQLRQLLSALTRIKKSDSTEPVTMVTVYVALLKAKSKLGKRGGSYTGPFYSQNSDKMKSALEIFTLWQETEEYTQLTDTQRERLQGYGEYFRNLPASVENNYCAAAIGRTFFELLYFIERLLGYPINVQRRSLLHNSLFCNAGGAPYYDTGYILRRISTYPALVREEDQADNIPLQIALQNKHSLEVIEALLSQHAAWQLFHVNREQKSVLDFAIATKNLAAAQYLLFRAGPRQLPRCQPVLRPFFLEGTPEALASAQDALEQAFCRKGAVTEGLDTFLRGLREFFQQEKGTQAAICQEALEGEKNRRILAEERERSAVRMHAERGGPNEPRSPSALMSFITSGIALFSPKPPSKKASSSGYVALDNKEKHKEKPS